MIAPLETLFGAVWLYDVACTCGFARVVGTFSRACVQACEHGGWIEAAPGAVWVGREPVPA
jgi:hypothetical protein